MGGTQFDGSSGASCSQTFDAGAIRIVNNSGQTMDVTDVLVTIGGATFDLWNGGGAFTIASGTDEVLTQTVSFNLDTSDFGKHVFPRQFGAADRQNHLFPRRRSIAVANLH